MADEAEDVLELTPEDEIEGEKKDQDEPGDPAEEDEEQEDEESELFVGFEGEEAAPASESESSVIRELRKANREQAKRISELERGTAPPKVEVGEKPTLESCEYDEEKFEAELTDWHQRKAQADRQDRDQQQAAEKQREEWQQRAKAYEADKTRLAISDYDDAEGEVFAALPAETQALLMLSEKPAALVYALSRNPGKLAELSKLNLARAAMMIGKLEEKVQVTNKRKPPQPDTPVRGNAAPVSVDKELARLEKEADRTGDRTKLISYRKKLKERA